MKNLASGFERIVKALDLIWRAACILMIILIVGVTFTQIISRKLLGSPLSWTEEFTKLLFVWVNCIGSAVAIRSKSHIQFDFLLTKTMQPREQNMVRIITNMVIIGFFIALIGPTAQLVKSMNTIPSAALSWPSGIPHLGYLIGMLAMIFAFLGDCVEAVGEIGKGGTAS